jgi:hypothetical protein
VAAKAESAEKLKARVDELTADLARAERKTKALQEVGLALGSTLDLDQLLELILKKITDLLDADRATLYLLDEQRKRLLSRIMIGDEARAIELPDRRGHRGPRREGGAHRPRQATPTATSASTASGTSVTGYRTRSILAAPMKNHVGRTIGVIQVLNKRADEKTIERKSKRRGHDAAAASEGSKLRASGAPATASSRRTTRSCSPRSRRRPPSRSTTAASSSPSSKRTCSSSTRRSSSSTA